MTTKHVLPMAPSPKARYWILTVPQASFMPYLPPQCVYLRGQLETGEGGFIHWQLYAVFPGQVRLPTVRDIFGPFHAEPTKSDAAREYVWKELTRIEGTQFELGSLPFRRNSAPDWDGILEDAKRGEINKIPSDIVVRCYNQLRRIAGDHVQPPAIVRSCDVFWGATGTGKSRRAWEEAGLQAFAKDPRSKWWDGYMGQESVVIDEFRGTIDISHLLRWLDRYPVRVENKGGALPLLATKFWITSNLDPRMWYPELDGESLAALLRRLNITHFL